MINPLIKSIIDTVGRQTGGSPDEIESMIAIPKESDLGDYTLPCFKFSKTLRKAPAVIAQELASYFEENPQFRKVESVNGYLNFFVDRRAFVQYIIEVYLPQKESIGKLSIGTNQRVIVEFSSPNIAKPFGVGHLRSTVIGHALANLYANGGYEVIRINHLGDWGTQFGKLITAFELWGIESELEKNPIKHLYELYVKFHQVSAQDSSLEDSARQWFKKLEAGDSRAQSYWRHFRELSLREFEKIYTRLGVHFDHYTGEAFYSDKMEECIRQIEAKGITSISEGALIVDLNDQQLTPCLLRKSDGATLYATRDLSAALYRWDQYHFDKNIYVVGSAQALHFQQLFAVLKKMEFPWAAHCIHIPFGMILGISTRKGTLVFLEDVLDEARDQAKTIIQEKQDEFPALDLTADKIAISAIIFQDLSNRRIKDIEFNLQKMISFDGDTGPYLLYTLVRIQSVFKKVMAQQGKTGSIENVIDSPTYLPAWEDLINEEALELIKLIPRFETALENAMQQNEPSILANYLIDVGHQFNRFYHSNRVLSGEQSVSVARLYLLRILYHLLHNGLRILGLQPIERM